MEKSIRLLVEQGATPVALFVCTAENAGDAAGGCEHAASAYMRDSAYICRFIPQEESPAELVGQACCPLSSAMLDKPTPDQARAYIQSVADDARKRVERMGVVL